MLNDLVKSENFYVGFDSKPSDAIKRGRIYLNGNHFANFYSLDPSWGKHKDGDKTGWFAINRDGVATGMGCPVIEPCPTLKDALDKMESFITKFKQEFLK